MINLNSESCQMGREYGLDHLSNRHNINMNNIIYHDWEKRDVNNETDYIIPIHGQEFPRFSSINKSKHLMKNNE